MKPDWSDLPAIIRYLENHPNLASEIANRQRERFVRGGYLSNAAEVCYWRALLRGWAGSAKLVDGSEGGNWPGEEEGTEGGSMMGWEEYSLTGRVGWA